MLPIKIPLILADIDNLLLDNYERKFKTYLELGWDKKSIKEYLKLKENSLKIASFNTATDSFTASSRRNRFYEIYNRNDMLVEDVEYKGAIHAMRELVDKFEIHIISSRTEDLAKKTLLLMERMGFPIQKLNIYFLPPNTSLDLYRQDEFERVAKNHKFGFAIIINPQDNLPFERYNFRVIGFTSIHYTHEFEIREDVEVCDDWRQILSYLRVATSDEELSKLTSGSESKIDIIQPLLTEEVKAESQLEQTVYQQLFMGAHRIMDSGDGKGKVIAGVSSLLKTFFNEIKSKLPLIYQNKYSDFFQYFEKRFDIDLKPIQENLEMTLSMVENIKSEGFTVIYIVLTRMLEEFRRHAYETYGYKLIDNIYKELTSFGLPEAFKQKLKKLSDQNDSEVVLLYNLSFLAWLSKLFSNQDIAINLERVLINQANKIITTKLFQK